MRWFTPRYPVGGKRTDWIDDSPFKVQRELLGMIHGVDIVVPMDYGFSEYGHRVPISTRDIPFIACGAFSGMDELLRENRTNIGFP